MARDRASDKDVLQSCAVCCSRLQCVAVCCSVWQCVAVCRKCVAVTQSMALKVRIPILIAAFELHVYICCSLVHFHVLQSVAVFFNLLQCGNTDSIVGSQWYVYMCCSPLQSGKVCCSARTPRQ